MSQPCSSKVFISGDSDFASPEESLEFLNAIFHHQTVMRKLEENEKCERDFIARKLKTDEKMLELGLTQLNYPNLELELNCNE